MRPPRARRDEKARTVRWGLAALVVVAAGCGGPARAPVAAPTMGAAGSADRFVDGLRYQVRGVGPITVVLVHGNFDRLETWEPIVPALTAWARVVTVDLPGFGRSENRADDFSLRGLARGVERVIDAVGAERVVIVGNSLGGAVAATVAAAAQQRIAGLVLEDANFLGGEWPRGQMTGPLLALMQAAAVRAERPDDPAAGEALRLATRDALVLALPAPGTVNRALIESYAPAFEGAGWRAVKRVQSDVDHAPTAAAMIAARARHGFPVLIVWGMDDPMIPVEHADRIARALDGARLWLIGGTGHAPHLERPAELAAALEAAFGPGGALPADDVVVVPDGAEVQLVGTVARAARVARAVRRHHAAAGEEAAREEAPWLALDELALGHVDAAEAAAAPLTGSSAPLDGDHLALVRGLIAEARGEPAIALYLRAAASSESRTREAALGRLALLELDDPTAAQVDAAIGPRTEHEMARRRVARLDRALASHRYEDALRQLDGWSVDEPAFLDLRRAMALLGAGRVDEVGRFLRPVSGLPAPGDRVAALRRPIERCKAALATLERAARGLEAIPLGPCALPLDVGSLADTMPPPRLRDLGAAPDPRSPLGAVTLATAALARGDDAGALAALAAVPAGRADQAPAYHRLQLALAAAAGDRGAVGRARALLTAHGGGWPWRWALATTLHAAGKAAEAERELALVLAFTSHEPAREELARVAADLGRVDEGKAILAGLARAIGWVGTPPLPHQRAGAAKLAPPRPPPPAPRAGGAVLD